ncbi:MAG TPA: head GIN domain-containing protein [Allosphingosinicella sp.]|nr:head GIN domain-containing protein [Allosphingosinicella sp.]
MIRTLPLALLALAAALPAGAAERRHSVTDFDRVEVDGPYQVTLRTGLVAGARVEGSADAIERVSIDVQGNRLRIRRSQNAWGGYPGDKTGPVKVSLTTRELRAASVVGSGSLEVDRARGLRVDLSVSGSGRLAVAAVDTDNLVVGLIGGGRIALAGRTRQLKATVQGSGDLAAAGLRAEDARITADTAGTVTVAVARAVTLKASGPGDVEIIGAPSCTVEGEPSGNVICGKAR